MESGDAGAGGPSADDHRPPAATEIDVEEFLRSAYGAGLISLQVGEVLLQYLDELKTRSAAVPAASPMPVDAELVRSRTAIAAATTRVHAALLRGEILPLKAEGLTDKLEAAGKSGDIAPIRAALAEAKLALEEAQSAQRTARRRRADRGRPQPPQQPTASTQARPTTAAPAQTRPIETTPTPTPPDHTPVAEGPPPQPRTPPPERATRVEPEPPPVRQAPAMESPPPARPTPAPVPTAPDPEDARPRPEQPATRAMAQTTAAPRPPGPFARLGKKLSDTWKTTTADFAANTLTYLGVLLAIIVIFVFFAFGYFGDVVSNANLRPPFFVAVPIVFFGIAWVLRTRTGLPAAASAVGLIGALTVPVMISALFRDWAPFPPDLHGSDRYWGYALAGALSALIYLYLATRERIYAYLVAPVLWAAAGSLGLYWRGGMSGPQLFTVLAVIIASFAVASRWQTGRVGEMLAVPTARVAIVAAPFVFVVSLVLAYNDAVTSGVAEPGIRHLAQPGAIAAALLAAVLGLASGSDFAWQELGPRTRAGLRISLRILAYAAVGTALVLSLAFEVSTGWLGIAFLGYGVALWGIDRVVKGTGNVALWISRGAIVVGLVLAAAEPIPAIVGWSLALAVAGARAVVPKVRSATSVLLPAAREPAAWLAELWIPLFMVAGAGVARLVDTPFVPWVLLVAAGAAALTRWLPPSIRALRTYAIFPAAVLAVASLAATAFVHLDVEPYEAGEAGALFLGFALVAAMTWLRWMWRSPLFVAATVAGAVLVIVEWVEPGRSGIIMAETVVLIAAGALLVAASHIPMWRHWAYVNGLLGTICLYSAVVVGVLTEDSMLVALSALVVSHGAEAIAAQRGSSPFIAEAADLTDTHRGFVEGAPATVAAIAALPLALLIGRRIPWLSDERPRSSFVLVSLALMYTAAAFYLRKPARRILVGLAYLSAIVAIGVAFPSRPASLVAVSGAAVVTFGLAVCLRRPGLSTPSWLLGVVGVVLAAAQLGVQQDALYRPLFLVAITLAVVGGALNMRGDERSGITNPWMVPPILVGLLAIPVSLSFSIAADSWVWMLAGVSAVAVGFMGWAVGTGGVAAAVAAYAGIAYASALSSHVNVFSDEPIYWIPFAAALVILSAFLPGRKEWRVLHDASPGTLLAGLATAAMAVVFAIPNGSPAPVLGLSSLLLGIVWYLRHNDVWLQGGVVALVGAAAIAGGGWLSAGFAVAALVETALAEYRRNRTEAVVYRWVGAVFWVAAYVFFVVWAGWSPETVTAVTITLGAVVSGIALAAYLVVPTHRVTAMWLWPIAAIGQTALVGAGLYAGDMLTTTDALLAGTALAAIEAALVATYATVRLDQTAAWISTALGTAAFGLLTGALQTDPIDLLRVTGPIGAALLAVWVILAVTRQRARLELWRWPSLALAQAALATTAGIAAINLDPTTAAGTLAAITAWEALLFSTTATLNTTKPEAIISLGFGLGSYAAFLRWLELDVMLRTNAWLGLTLFLMFSATLFSRRAESQRAAVWSWPLQGTAAASAIVTVVSGADSLAGTDTRLVVSAVVAAAGIHALANRPLFQPYVDVDTVAALAGVAAGALATTALDPTGSWAFPVLLTMALIGAMAPLIIGRLGEERVRPVIILVVGYSIIPVVAAAAFWGPFSSEVGYLLIVSGAGLAGYGVAAHRLVALEAAAAVWLGAVLILINERFGLELHFTIVLVAVVLLAVLDVERYRRIRKGLAQPEVLRAAEWVVMVLPLMIAVVESFDSLAYVLLLAAEGAALMTWGGFTRVRRRAVVGLIAITTAIALGVLIPLVGEVREGLTGGGWLIVGAVAALIFIVAGSLIEKQRVRIGEQLSRWGEILEAWE